MQSKVALAPIPLVQAATIFIVPDRFGAPATAATFGPSGWHQTGALAGADCAHGPQVGLAHRLAKRGALFAAFAANRLTAAR